VHGKVLARISNAAAAPDELSPKQGDGPNEFATVVKSNRAPSSQKTRKFEKLVPSKEKDPVDAGAPWVTSKWITKVSAKPGNEASTASSNRAAKRILSKVMPFDLQGFRIDVHDAYSSAAGRVPRMTSVIPDAQSRSRVYHRSSYTLLFKRQSFSGFLRLPGAFDSAFLLAAYLGRIFSTMPSLAD